MAGGFGWCPLLVPLGEHLCLEPGLNIATVDMPRLVNGDPFLKIKIDKKYVYIYIHTFTTHWTQSFRNPEPMFPVFSNFLHCIRWSSTYQIIGLPTADSRLERCFMDPPSKNIYVWKFLPLWSRCKEWPDHSVLNLTCNDSNPRWSIRRIAR